MKEQTPSRYWEKIASRRLSRRRALLATGSAAGAAALLAACGGGDDEEGAAKKDVSGLLTQPVDTTKSAKSGGTYKFYLNADARTFDPHIREVTAAFHVEQAYETLVRQKQEIMRPAVRGDVEPGYAQSWEYSPDKLQITFKIQPEGKWDPRPPTNGRAIDANDVAYTFQRYAQIATFRSDLANSVNPYAPVVSVSAPDSKTVVMKLAAPYADLLAVLRWSTAGSMSIVPPESQAMDLRTEMRGSGGFYLSEYVPSARFVYTRNPGYYNKQQPYISRMEVPIITEYSAGMAQFKTGGVYHFAVSSDDAIRVKKETPQLQMFISDRNSPGSHLFFGYQDGPKSLFRDERLRQAFMLSLDRELWIDTFYNVTKFRAEGLPMETAWDTCIGNAERDWWLDPQDKTFGPNAKYFKYDPDEARKLLAAAGYASGLDVECPCLTTPQYGATFPKQGEVLLNMAQDVGIRAKIIPIDFVTEWRPKVADTKGNFAGLSFILAGPTGNRQYLFSTFNTKGSLFRGFSADGNSTFAGDPVMEDLTTKIVGEFDDKKAQAIAADIQRYDAKKLYAPYFPGGSNIFYFAWPALSNFFTYRGTGGFGGVLRDARNIWIDETKEPVKRA